MEDLKKEKLKEYMKLYRVKNKDKIKKQKSEYYENNAVAISEKRILDRKTKREQKTTVKSINSISPVF